MEDYWEIIVWPVEWHYDTNTNDSQGPLRSLRLFGTFLGLTPWKM